MKRIISNTAILLIFTLSFISCDRPKCTNNNPIFDQNEPNSKVYKDELVKQLQNVDQSKLTYWLQKYVEEEGQEYLYFYIQGDGLCAKLVLQMDHWNQMERLHEKKGVSYRNAEFVDLKFKIQQDANATNFIYESYDRIID